MKNLYKILKAISVLAGIFLLVCGTTTLYLAATQRANEGQTSMVVFSASIVAVAMILLVIPFSLRSGMRLLAIVLSFFAIGMLWLVFAPDSVVHRHPGNLLAARCAAIAFALLLAFRLRNSIRRPKPQEQE